MRLVIACDEYIGIKRRALDMLSGELGSLTDYVLPLVTMDDAAARDTSRALIAIGESGELFSELEKRGLLPKPTGEEGYSVYVGEYGGRPVMAVRGGGAVGTLYGCYALFDKYLGAHLLGLGITARELLSQDSYPAWSLSRTPAVKTRAIWTWGHVIYDYRGFFSNMARLSLNEAVIWNDRLPMNADEAVAFAHSLGIKVIWGFAWGWTTSCEQYASALTEADFPRIKEQVLELYEREYKNAPGDGIYFQSFTELKRSFVGDICIAEAVTRLVNETASELLLRYPELHIQFGLHASSVKEQLDIIAKVDKRLYIVWEDLGAFPFSYETSDTEGYRECSETLNRLTSLRGKGELFGAVLKGMPNLDWTRFEHFTERYVMGCAPREFIEKRYEDKLARWRELGRGWLKSASLAAETVKKIAHAPESIAEMLVEDALFEYRIMLPTALVAELLIDPMRNTDELIAELRRESFIFE